MKIVTLYSPSHKGMMEEFFLPSFPKDDRLQLKIVEAPQLAGETPQFNSPQWSEFMHIKAKLLWDELLSIDEGEIYGFLDVDIVNVNNFHDYIVEGMKDLDFVAQSDSPSLNFLNICTGVIFFKNNENCRNLLKAVNVYLDRFKNEQEALTHFARDRGKYEELRDLRFGLLPFNRAFTYGSLGGQVWDGTDVSFSIPPKENLFWLHANYSHHEQKIPLLNLFRQKLNV